MENFVHWALVVSALAMMRPDLSINADEMYDMCDDVRVTRKERVMVGVNMTQDGGQQATGNCHCLLTVPCGNTLLFQVIALKQGGDGGGECWRVVVAEGGNDEAMVIVNCSSSVSGSSSGQAAVGSVFRSSSHTASLTLSQVSNIAASFAISVTALGKSTIQVLCGQADRADLGNDNQCVTGSEKALELPDRSTPKYNSSKQACLHGPGSSPLKYDFDMDCFEVGTPGVIQVERVFHGLTPLSLGCGSASLQEACCPKYDPDRDCLFSTELGMKELKNKCTGATMCSPRLYSVDVDGKCPSRPDPKGGADLTYGSHSFFAFVEFSCISTGLMDDICDIGSITVNKEVFLESNVYHTNRDKNASMCHCVIDTRCDQQLLFYPLSLNLASTDNGTCLEQLTFLDTGNSSVFAEFDCSHNEVDDAYQRNQKPVFKSQTNSVYFRLDFLGFHTGQVFFKVTATGDAVVELRCGRTTELWSSHQCRPTTTQIPATTPTPSSTAAASTTVTTAENKASGVVGNGSDLDLKIPLLAVISALCLCLILVFIICLAVFFVRKKRRHQERAQAQGQINYVCMPEMEGSDELAPNSFGVVLPVNLPTMSVESSKAAEAGLQDLGPEVQGAECSPGAVFYADLLSQDEYSKTCLPDIQNKENEMRGDC